MLGSVKLKQFSSACLRIPRFEGHQTFFLDRPCLVRGLAASWCANDEWRLNKLISAKYRDRLFQCGVDPHTGEPEVVTIEEFVRSRETCTQIFDPAFESDCPELLHHYTPPSQFQGQNDLFHVLGSDRPDFRWFLLGLKGSGTPLHIDPLCSSAWNTLVVGRKRWIMFSPHIQAPPSTPAYATGDGISMQASRSQEVGQWREDGTWQWCRGVQDALQNASGRAVFQFDQCEGDTVVVPAGWMHAVANMEDSVAVTHNFVIPENAVSALQLLREEDPNKASCWVRRLRVHYPSIAERLKCTGRRDRK